MTDAFERYFEKTYTITDKGKLRRIDKNIYPTDSDVYNDYKAVRESACVEVDVTMIQVSEYINAVKKSAKPEQKPVSVFVNEWLEAHKKQWVVSPAWKEIKLTKDGVETSKNLDQLRDAIMYDVYDGKLGYSNEAVKCMLSNLAMNGNQFALSNVVKHIKFDEQCVEAGDRWLRAVYDYLGVAESYEIFSTLMKHWFWCVKRKLNSLSVKYHIWVNWYGATGLGKTTALTKIMSPLEDFFSQTTINKLFDDTREIRRLTENYVLIFDELALNVEGEPGGGKLTADQKSTLKSIITGDKIDTRIYGSQNQARNKITFSCISSANDHLYDIIFDTTSMRRFFDINCTAKPPKSFDGINKYLDNSVYMWRAIDESRENGYWDIHSDVGLEISRIQASYYPTNTTTKMWIDNNNVVAGEGSLTTAYSNYSTWCRTTGNRAKAMQNFAEDIRHILPAAVSSNGAIHLSVKHEVLDSASIQPGVGGFTDWMDKADGAGE